MIQQITVVVDSINRNEGSGAKANLALIESLTLAGYTVTVLHFTRQDIQLPGVKCISIPEKRWNLLFVLSRLIRIIARQTGIQLNPFVEGLFGFSFTYSNDVNSIRQGVQRYSGTEPHLILTLSQGASFRPHAALLQLPHLHSKWMAYVHDPYPFHYYPRPYNWVERGYRQKETFFRSVSEKARYSGFPSLLLKEWMGSYFPQFLTTGVVIPHQVGSSNTQQTTLPSYFKQQAFTILHAGNLMKQRDPKGLINGFKLFIEQHPDAKQQAQLLLIGPADYHQHSIQAMVPAVPELVFVNENVPFDTVLEMQSRASVNVILESSSEISPFLPGKFPHCVVADKPILSLAPYYSETRRLLGTEYPYWSEQHDETTIATLLGRLYVLWKQDPGLLSLNRPDLAAYLSPAYLRTWLDALS